jgi:hypothetical protein
MAKINKTNGEPIAEEEFKDTSRGEGAFCL